MQDVDKAKSAQRFFKTGKGEYAEGDVFLGLTVPETRRVLQKYVEMTLEDVTKLLTSSYHEERLAAVILLTKQSAKADVKRQKEICDLYLQHASFVNNWDIVDVSAPMIVGVTVERQGVRLLKRLASSKNLWEKRIAIVSTLFCIRRGSSSEVQEIADMLLEDTHDLIHKAIGWMLREMGKSCGEEVLLQYLQTRYDRLPRTTLRNAIERFPVVQRTQLLLGKFVGEHGKILS